MPTSARAQEPKRWPYRGRLISYHEAVAQQNELRTQIVDEWDQRTVGLIAGVDVGVLRGRASAAVVLLSYPEFEVVESSTATRAADFPYIPGLLAFREVPVVVEAFEGLRQAPDLCLVDGHGRAHPRRCGVACQLGVELDLPAIGVGKTLFVGRHREPATARGSSTRLVHEGDQIGRALRTRANVRPVYVSIGHRIDLASAERWTLRCASRFRLPEPIRAAHNLADRVGRAERQ